MNGATPKRSQHEGQNNKTLVGSASDRPLFASLWNLDSALPQLQRWAEKVKARLAGVILSSVVLTTLPALSEDEKKERELIVLLPDGRDLAEGAPVQYRGIVIGSVADIRLHEKQPAAHIVLQASAPELSDSDAFRVEVVSLLGDPRLTIVPSNEPGKPLKDGAIVKAESLEDSAELSRLVSKLRSFPKHRRNALINEFLRAIEQERPDESKKPNKAR